MRRETRILTTALVVMLAAGLNACVASRSEPAGAQVAPAPALAPSPAPASEGGASIPGVTQAVASTTTAARPKAVPDDTRVVINAPAFRMDVFENGSLVKSYRIGIGYPKFPLPAGMRTADAIIFNPAWTPPDEPWVESRGGKVKIGRTIAAGDKLNPLGLVKIPIGSPSLIHGGKSPARIGGFASHGCVGLTNAQAVDFAKLLARLGGVEITDEQIAKYRRTRARTRYITLPQPIPVELRYETIVVEDGKLRVYRDVYKRGTNTEENLRSALAAHGVKLEDLSESERSQALAAIGQTARANGRLTRRVKDAQETVVEIAALAGKGYSAPVELDAGK